MMSKKKQSISKVKELREIKDTSEDIPQLLSKTSYCIIQADSKKQGADFANSVTLSYIKHINLSNGVYTEKSLLGSYIEFDNKKIPTDKVAVISTVSRKEKEFIKIDVSTQFINILCQMLSIENQGLITYAKRNLSKKPFDTAYYYLSMINSSCVKNKEFNVKDAGDILKDKPFESSYWFKDKYILTVECISYLNLPKIIELFKMFTEEDMDIYQVVGWLSYIDKESVPEYMQEEVNNAKTIHFKTNLLKVFASAITATDTKELFYRLLKFC